VAREYVGRRAGDAPPHVFAVAEAARAALLRDRAPVAIVVTGESGAGKTEASKQIVSYVTAVGAGMQAAGAAAGAAGAAAISPIAERLIAASEIAENFGNAATVKNNNSSRFGKLTRLSLTSSGRPLGGAVATFLLEAGRVVSHAEGERTFHIF
jgi:myosin heavy subunit